MNRQISNCHIRSGSSRVWCQDNDVIRQSNAYVVTYSMTDRSSYQWAYSFIDEVTQTRSDDMRRANVSQSSLSSHSIVVILVANKSDLVRKRQVSTEGERVHFYARATLA